MTQKPKKGKPTMKDKMLQLAIKLFLTRDTAKSLAHAVNAKLQETVELSDGKSRAAAYVSDAMETVAAYGFAVSDDGRISDAELANINAKVDSLIDKYMK